MRSASNPKISLFSIAATQLVHLALDSARAESPFITDRVGKKMDRNPLQDVHVRRALSLMIDRNALATRLLDGSAEPAGQFVPEGIGGYDPSLKPPAIDIPAAKKLLVEAGYPSGFG
jgi:peptide/nickel transport system substrate-binding protein